MANDDRRRSPRVEGQDLSVSLKLGEYDTIIHTVNVSSSGAYCKCDKEIPLMSRVRLIMMVPDPKKDGSPSRIEVTGVVVREHPVIIDGQTKHYDLAIFFEDIAQKDKEIISGYIANKKS